MSFHLNWDLHGVRGYVFSVFVIAMIWHRAPGRGGMKEWMTDGWMDGWMDGWLDVEISIWKEGREVGRKTGRGGSLE